MGSLVGSKGQIVISKEIRDRLGVRPGWTAHQRLVGDHVEVHFLPPPHRRSLRGAAAAYTDVVVSEDEWTAARERAWEDEVGERWAAPQQP